MLPEEGPLFPLDVTPTDGVVLPEAIGSNIFRPGLLLFQEEWVLDEEVLVKDAANIGVAMVEADRMLASEWEDEEEVGKPEPEPEPKRSPAELLACNVETGCGIMGAVRLCEF